MGVWVEKYIVIGTGGHANSLLDLIRSGDNKVEYFVGFENKIDTFQQIPVIRMNDIKKLPSKFKFVLGIGDFEIRNRILNEINLLLPAISFPPMIHKTAYVSNTASLGFGAVIMANAYVGPRSKIGDFSVLNTNTNVDHDCTIGNLNVLAPGTILAGCVLSGEKCFFGMGSLISNNISIGSNAIIAANSFVNSDIPNNSFVAGSPGKLKLK